MVGTIDLFSDKMVKHNVSSKNLSCQNSENWPRMYYCHFAQQYLHLLLNKQVQVKQVSFLRQDNGKSES